MPRSHIAGGTLERRIASGDGQVLRWQLPNTCPVPGKSGLRRSESRIPPCFPTVRRGNALVSEERARALGALTDHGDQLRLSWEAFETEFRRLWPTRVATFFDDAYLDRFLARVWTESLGFAGTELVRRIIGFAHLTDLSTLADPVPASRRALLLGRELIVRRTELTSPDAVRDLVASPLG